MRKVIQIKIEGLGFETFYKEDLALDKIKDILKQNVVTTYNIEIKVYNSLDY